MPCRILPVNFFDQATIAVTPAAVATMPVTNLQSNIRSNLWRSTSTVAQTITGTWSGDVRQISAIGIFPGKLVACLLGLLVQLELFSDVAMTNRVFNLGPVDAFTFTGQGWGNFAWGATPWGVDPADRTARLAPFVRYLTPTPASAFRITISNGGALDTNYIEASRIWLADYVDAPYTAKLGAEPIWVPGSEQQRTIGSTLRRVVRAKWRELQFEIDLDSEAARSAWSDLQYVSDVGNEIVLSIYPADATPKRERDFTVMGSLKGLSGMTAHNQFHHTLPLAVTES